MNVRELTQEQLDQLKYDYYYQLEQEDEVEDILGDNILYPCDIPNDIIFEHYDGIAFVEDDFFN